MGYWENLILVVSSIMASMVPVLYRFDDSLLGIFQFFTITIFTALAFPYSIIQTSIFGQRRSLRRKTQLTKEFFKEQKEIWKDELSNFPNNQDLLEKFDDEKYIPDLFDRGSFNLVILRSCNFMEKIIDSSIEGILSQNSEIEALFKKEKDKQKSYPVKLKNLDLEKSFTPKCKDTITSEILWHSLRNDIAHRNRRPSFKETFATMCYLVTFIQEIPNILQEWRKKNFLIK